MKATHGLAFVLVIVGALNWLLVGLFSWDIGEIFGGQGSILSRIIYILVGLSAIYLISTHKKDCKMCDNVTQVKTPNTPTTPTSNKM